MDVGDLDLVGCGPKGIGALLQSGSAGGVSFRGRDVGHDPPDGAGPEKNSAQDCAMDKREEAYALGVGELVIYSAGGSNGRIGL